jgi:hypothetical protein
LSHEPNSCCLQLITNSNTCFCSAQPLQDFSSGTFFNRVIDDGKASDNTRHLSHHPKTGEPYLLPPLDIRRVLLVTARAVALFCCGVVRGNIVAN